MFYVYVDKSNLHTHAEPALTIKSSEDRAFLVRAKTIEFKGKAVLRQAYPDELGMPNLNPIRAWIETEGPIVADAVEIK